MFEMDFMTAFRKNLGVSGGTETKAGYPCVHCENGCEIQNHIAENLTGESTSLEVKALSKIREAVLRRVEPESLQGGIRLQLKHIV
jgi:hypothetical protein